MPDRRGLVSHQFDDRGAEAHRDRPVGLEDRLHLPRRPAPLLARLVDVPGTLHPHVAVDREAIVEPDQQVLADRLDLGDLLARQSLEIAGTGIEQRLAFEREPQGGGRAPDRVAFGHNPEGYGAGRQGIPAYPFAFQMGGRQVILHWQY